MRSIESLNKMLLLSSVERTLADPKRQKRDTSCLWDDSALRI